MAAQDAAAVELPASLPRFATHLKMHLEMRRGLMPARSGDLVADTSHARAPAGEALPDPA
ncbi:hypothetical protein [Streptomyces erythrochromogenes]|uniref:hypothetical protein n=1 Tax=Streptomyces erythrochromogenes TaxID=285574 RepID=UPI00386413D9|nr:hypothetical protein OG489_02855 [Streptomyces erythrochromogenes]